MRMRLSRSLILFAVLALVPAGDLSRVLRAASVQDSAQPVEFNRDIRPILAEACFACHGPAETTRQADLRLDTSDFIGTAVVPGDAEGSPLFQRVTTDEPIGRMPPASSGRPLTTAQIDVVRRWIDAGAEWESDLAATNVGGTGIAGRTVDFAREVRPILSEHCFSCHGPDEQARQRGLRLDVPEGPFADRGQFGGPVIIAGNPADSPLFHRITASDAETRMPYRRGLRTSVVPGRDDDALTNAEVETLRVWIDQGAEWQSHWAFIPPERRERSMWRWRDWVIAAYNDNMPFDQFTIEQIAGDLLPDATLDQRIATGFNRNHSQNGEGGIIPEEFLVENVVDRVAITSTVWLGLTLGCARCHDHKFDPISKKEFYEVFAFFNNIPELGKAFKYGNSPPFVTAPTWDQYAELGKLDAGLRQAREAFSSLETETAAERQRWEDSLPTSGRVDWVLRDQLLVHHPLDGDIAGVYTRESERHSASTASVLSTRATSRQLRRPVHAGRLDLSHGA